MHLKSAIEEFNKRASEPLTHNDIGAKIFEGEGLESVTERHYITSWCNGKHMGKMKPIHIERLCDTLLIDANLLFGITPMKRELPSAEKLILAKKRSDEILSEYSDHGDEDQLAADIYEEIVEALRAN